ncbi:MAG: rod shape-determining protein [Acutalibacteraceae bacterium]|nr:rod shape-determining protein [Acutalibacteraceae bacterium]
MPGLNLGIDLGTDTIKIFAQGKGIILSERNAISYDSINDETIAIGTQAAEMEERTPDSIVVKRPVQGGVISDFSAMTEILTYFIKKICKNHIFRPNMVISAPCCVTSLEKKTVVESACAAGAGKVHIVDEPIISALGAGVSIEHPRGVMVIDMGSGTTDIAVITMGTVAYATSLKTAGDSMDEAISSFLKRDKDIVSGLPTARKIKHILGSAIKREEEIEIICSGKDYITGMPRQFNVNSSEIYNTLQEPLSLIFDGIMDVMDQLPAELYSDICTEGILLTGAGSKLFGADRYFSERLGIKVTCAVDAENCAAKGAGYILRNMKRLEDNGYYFRSKEIIFD